MGEQQSREDIERVLDAAAEKGLTLVKVILRAGDEIVGNVVERSPHGAVIHEHSARTDRSIKTKEIERAGRA